MECIRKEEKKITFRCLIFLYSLVLHTHTQVHTRIIFSSSRCYGENRIYYIFVELPFVHASWFAFFAENHNVMVSSFLYTDACKCVRSQALLMCDVYDATTRRRTQRALRRDTKYIYFQSSDCGVTRCTSHFQQKCGK